MIQRFERRPIEEELNIAREQLRPHLQQLAQIPNDQLTSSDSASLIMLMINKLSAPIVGIQVIRNSFEQTDFPLLGLYELIMNKAEAFYCESMMADLNKIKNNEDIIQLNKEEIRQCVQQLNWKMHVERSSVINDSQEIGEQIDLMKFFQGVRNYQNWQEKIKRQCLQRLKQKSYDIQRQLTFKKGFMISKIQQIISKIRDKNMKELYTVSKKNRSYYKLQKTLIRIFLNQKLNGFSLIYKQSLLPLKNEMQLHKMFQKYYNRKILSETRKIFFTIKSKRDIFQKLILTLGQFKRKRQFLLKNTSFKQLNIKPMIKASRITQSVQKLTQLSKKVIVRYMFKKFNIVPKVLFNKLSRAYTERTQYAFNIMKQINLDIIIRRPKISEKLKGKILVSFNKFEKQPINLKKTFDKWYLNSHQNKFAKKIYNIWFQGGINKFVTFMRLKNLCDMVHKQMVSKEMRDFIKVLCQRFEKYEQYNKKCMFKSWISNTRRIRKVQKMFNTLNTITNETEENFQRYTVQKINQYCRKRQIVNNYLKKYLYNFINNRKIAVQQWSKINNIKKIWGRIRLRKLMIDITIQMKQTAKQTMEVFKANRNEGRRKKIILYNRTFKQYSVVLQNFIQVWRFNSFTTKIQKNKRDQNISQVKSNSLKNIGFANKKITDAKLKETIDKFRSNATVKSRRINGIKNNFMKAILNGQQNLKKDVLDVFLSSWRQGKSKKQKLVIKLVNSNFIKQKLAFSIINSKSKFETQLLKREKCAKIYEILQDKINQNYIIFNKRLFLGKVLSRILINYTENAQLALNKWKAIPLRIRWKLRSKIIKLDQSLKKLVANRFNECQDSFKSSFEVAKTKKKRGVYIMANKFQILIRKYFKKYHENSIKLKQDHKIKMMTNIFQSVQGEVVKNTGIVMNAVAEWPKKLTYFEKLNEILKKRVRSYYLCWQQNARAITYCDKIVLERKQRLLENLNSLLESKRLKQQKLMIQNFDHNRRITNLQINFLKKLCESQAGKLFKGFMVWKSMPIPGNKQKILCATKFEANLLKFFHKNLRQTLNGFKGSHRIGQDKKTHGIHRLVDTSVMEMRKYFQKWLFNNKLISLSIKNKKVENLFALAQQQQHNFYKKLITGNEAQRKRKALNLVERWWDNQKRYCIKKWSKNSADLKRLDISKRHLLKNANDIKSRHTKKQILEKVIMKFYANRRLSKKEKNRQKTEGLLKIIQNQNAFKLTLLNQSLDKLVYNHYRGNFIKKQSFHKFLKEKIGAVHSILSLWDTLAQQAKQNHKQRIIADNFSTIEQILKANYRTIMVKGNQQVIKKHTLDKLFNAQSLKFKAYFLLWRQRIKQMKIASEMDDRQKKIILDNLNKMLNNTSNQSVIDTIRKFNMNSKIIKVQRKFIQKLLGTKSGMIINAFNTWKKIPMHNMKGKVKDYQKSYFRLENFYRNRLKLVHSSFMQQSEGATLMKKQSILKLFQMTSLGIRRFYNRWTRLTRERHSLMQVNYTFQTFSNVQHILQHQYDVIFNEKETYKKKIKAIQKLIVATKQTIYNYVSHWKSQASRIKMIVLRKNQAKIAALKMLNSLAYESNLDQASHAIRLFQKNSKMVKISKNFLTRLMMTKTGKVLQFLSKLKTLPDAKINKMKKKGIIFESKLHHLHLKRLRDSLLPFKDSTYSANQKMKYCLDRLQRACMGQNQKKFLIWRNVVREDKILRHTSLFEQIFENIEGVYKTNISIIIDEAKPQLQKKKGLCRKLLMNSSFVQHHAFMLWRQSCRVEDINTIKKQIANKTHLKNLEAVVKDHQNKKIIQAISEFRTILYLRNNEESNYVKQYKNKKCLAFYNNLKALQRQRKSNFIEILKQSQSTAVLSDKSKKLQSLFQAMQNFCQNNMNYLLRTSQTQNSIIQQALSKIYQNQKLNISKSLSMWRQKKKDLQKQQLLKRQKQTHSLRTIKSLLDLNKKYRIIQVINSFKAKVAFQKIKKRICVKMLNVRSNKFESSFKNWKNVPYQQAKKLKSKATKFEKGLFLFFTNNLRQSFEAFKKQGLQGITKKQNSVRTIVRSKLSDINRLFFKWRKIVNQNKITEKIVCLDKAFLQAENAFKDNITIFQGSKVNDQRKIRAITKMFNNNVQRLRQSVLIWRKSTRTIKLHLFERYMRNFNPEDFNKRLLRISWIMIEKKQDMQQLKGYINSLWKWKMSNIQASYYTKFLKILRQSQELVRFSNLITKKLYENIHRGFRNILSVGQQRTNRKKQIVQKYLTRKVRNYLVAFKNATLKSEINVWRFKYSDVIKAKVVYDILSTLILKSKFAAIQSLKGFQIYADKIDILEQKYQNYNNGNLKQAFSKIKYAGHQQLFSISQNLSKKSKKSCLMESFDLIKGYSKIFKLVHHLQKTMFRNLLYVGFNRINKKKQRVIKCTLSLNLIQTLIVKSDSQLKRIAIAQFVKNRMKRVGVQKIFKILRNKYQQYSRNILENGAALVNLNKLLQRFKRGQAMKKIIQKQDALLQKTYLNKMRKKQNKWMELAIQKFATRASIRSSPAICLWRLKTYVANS